jgi:hypothetical protein
MLTIRIDDISVNTNQQKLKAMTDIILKKYPECQLILGVSLAVFNLEAEADDLQKERVFPKILNAYSDHTKYFACEKIGIPKLDPRAKIASHGLVHVDHRLLSKECQELSILFSCSVLKTNIFIPPFNKWNRITSELCILHNIELIQFERGWQHLKYEKFLGTGRYYFHTHDFTLPGFEKAIS